MRVNTKISQSQKKNYICIENILRNKVYLYISSWIIVVYYVCITICKSWV